MIDVASLSSLFAMWLAIGLCGLLAWPLAALLFPDNADRGYLAAKPLGWLIGAYAAWLSSVFGASFAEYGWAFGLAALTVIAALFGSRLKPLPHVRAMAMWEVGFLLLFLVGALIKARVPDIHGLEKYMDFGFVNAALRATTMPPPDMWWAGQPINYYYFGHLATAWLIEVSRVPSDRGFNLMMGLIFAFLGSLSFSIVSGTLRARGRALAGVCGGAAAALVTLGGNFHSVLYGPLRPWSPTSYTRDFYYPDSTRFIGFDPPTDDKGFTELPSYGFAVGDLHAHVLNLPTAFLLILLLSRILKREWGASPGGGVRLVEAAAIGLLLAISYMANSWDVLTYGLMMALVGLFLLAHWGRQHPSWSFRLIGMGIGAAAAAMLLALPFILRFQPISTRLVWFDGHSPLWQLAIVYGQVLVPAAVLVVGLLVSSRRRDPRWIVGALFVLTAFVLVAMPEFFYVKDIYGRDNRRANTMFKFAFEAQPMAVLGSMILVGILVESRRRLVALVGLITSVPLFATLCYAENIYGDTVRNSSMRAFTLDGLRFLSKDHPDDAALVAWLRRQPPQAHILLLEAPGDSYSEGARLSALSGVPTLLGWRGHEWLWRGDNSIVYALGDSVTAFYQSKTVADACAFIKQHSITHVAIGSVERSSYPNLNTTVLRQLGSIAVQSGQSAIIAVQSNNCP